jgi:hypothetical protein
VIAIIFAALNVEVKNYVVLFMFVANAANAAYTTNRKND